MCDIFFGLMTSSFNQSDLVKYFPVHNFFTLTFYFGFKSQGYSYEWFDPLSQLTSCLEIGLAVDCRLEEKGFIFHLAVLNYSFNFTLPRLRHTLGTPVLHCKPTHFCHHVQRCSSKHLSNKNGMHMSLEIY